jgi:DNA-binding NarL/FixJ family response regulator
MAAEQVRVLVVSSDPVARAGLAAWLARDEGLEVDSAPSMEHARDRGLPPHVVLLDVGLAPRALDLRPPLEDVPTIALISDADQAPLALAAGARGAVFRDTQPARLAEALRAAALGLVVLDETLARTAFKPAAPAEDAELAESLTAREREVLSLLAEGLSNRLIAARLGISEHTAKFHVNSILGKLGASSRGEAVAQAARLGLVLL